MAAIDREQPIFNAETMDQQIAAHEMSQRFGLFMLSGFAVIAVFLAVGGLYSAVVMNLQSRLHELGIRMALGAARGGIFRLILFDSCKLALLGILLGVVGAFLFGRAASAIVFGSSSIRLADLVCIALLFFFTTMLAACLAARQAGHLDTGEFLRIG